MLFPLWTKTTTALGILNKKDPKFDLNVKVIFIYVFHSSSKLIRTASFLTIVNDIDSKCGKDHAQLKIFLKRKTDRARLYFDLKHVRYHKNHTTTVYVYVI